MFEDWFDKRLASIKTETDAERVALINELALTGKMLVDYFFLQFNGVGFTTQQVKKAEPVEQ